MNIDDRLNAAAQAIDEFSDDPARAARRYERFLDALTPDTQIAELSVGPSGNPDSSDQAPADADPHEAMVTADSTPPEAASPDSGITCDECLDRLYELLDGELDESDAALVREHIEECLTCLEEYGLADAIKERVRRVCGSDRAPADLHQKIRARLEKLRSGSHQGESLAGDSAMTSPRPPRE